MAKSSAIYLGLADRLEKKSAADQSQPKPPTRISQKPNNYHILCAISFVQD